VPRALARDGCLERLITDAWHVKGRFHRQLANKSVTAFNLSLLCFELLSRIKHLRGCQVMTARNEWFQRKATNYLSSYRLAVTGSETIVFSYSYAAREIFRLAKQRGWKTVLGQIDPGPVEEEIVAKEVMRVPELTPNGKRAPNQYWENWREECRLADGIIVNSGWSQTCLMDAGVSSEKLIVIPLAYDSTIAETAVMRDYPARFSAEHPLRVLFLGQVNVRKGVARLFDAIRMLHDQPVDFQFVGPLQIKVPADLANRRNIRFAGTVAREKADVFYRSADVLIFPTLSDGFGLVQLEAQAWKVPVIASTRCGEVVTDGTNGVLLEETTAAAIARAISFCVENPRKLSEFSKASGVGERFRLSSLAAGLNSLESK
jgi:glycosyltransferase involved in cell wall biosynthesis